MLNVEPEEFSAQWWKSFAHHWWSYNEASTPTQTHCFHMNEVFANRSDKDEIYPLKTAKLRQPNGPMHPWSTSLSAMQYLIKDWRSNSLRTRLVSAKMVGWLSPRHSKCMQLNGITTTNNTLDTHVSKRWWILRCTGKVCVPPSGQ